MIRDIGVCKKLSIEYVNFDILHKSNWYKYVTREIDVTDKKLLKVEVTGSFFIMYYTVFDETLLKVVLM